MRQPSLHGHRRAERWNDIWPHVYPAFAQAGHVMYIQLPGRNSLDLTRVPRNVRALPWQEE
eukprot:8013991-Pyramimonas_sp.AAC.1